MSYTASYYHIVFGTYLRAAVLNMSPEIKEEFCMYVGGILRNHKCKLMCANYMPDHVHMLIDLSVEKALADVVGTVKQSTSMWLKKEGRCPKFIRWAKEYYGVSLCPTHTVDVERYILGQEAHHQYHTFDQELDRLITKAGMQRYPDSFIY